jgi:hypothetical protein
MVLSNRSIFTELSIDDVKIGRVKFWQLPLRFEGSRLVERTVGALAATLVLAESDEYLPLDAAAALLHPLITEIILLGILESLVGSWG